MMVDFKLVLWTLARLSGLLRVVYTVEPHYSTINQNTTLHAVQQLKNTINISGTSSIKMD